MSAPAKKQNRRYDDIPGEVTTKTKAAIDLLRVAKATGIFGRLMSILSGGCDKLSGDDTGSPRPGERRKDKWRGQEKEDTESWDPTDTTTSGESSLLDQKARERWRRLEAKERRKKKQRLKDVSSREE